MAQSLISSHSCPSKLATPLPIAYLTFSGVTPWTSTHYIHQMERNHTMKKTTTLQVPTHLTSHLIFHSNSPEIWSVTINYSLFSYNRKFIWGSHSTKWVSYYLKTWVRLQTFEKNHFTAQFTSIYVKFYPW